MLEISRTWKMLALALATGAALMGRQPVQAFADAAAEANQVKYTDEKGATRRRPLKQFESDLGALEGDDVSLNSAWYYVSRDKTIAHRVDVVGDARIVLGPEATLTCAEGIHVPSDKTLAVYSLKDAPGKLLADARQKGQCAGIGGNDDEDGGVVTIYGGNVEASGGSGAAGIGGGEGGCAGKIDIRDGSVFARSKEFGAGIGCGRNASGGTVDIAGGTIVAMGGDDGAGIGGGEGGNLSGITIAGGDIRAIGKGNAAGIGGGEKGDCARIAICDAKVSAEVSPTRHLAEDSESKSAFAAAIGSGYEGKGGDILIEDATVTAKACTEPLAEIQTKFYSYGAAIGNGAKAETRGTVTITRSNVTAQANYGAAIGGGADGCGCERVDIKKSTVYAESHSGAGIGGGSNCTHVGRDLTCGSQTTIDSSDVTAISWGLSAGIGGGGDYSGTDEGARGGDVDIRGTSTVRAQGAASRAIGAGHGRQGDNGKLTIDEGLKVTDLSKHVGRVAAKAKREAWCQQRAHVQIEPSKKKSSKKS